MTRTNLHLPDDMLQRLRLAKAQTGIPVVVLVRQAVDHYLDMLKIDRVSHSANGGQLAQFKENHHDE